MVTLGLSPWHRRVLTTIIGLVLTTEAAIAQQQQRAIPDDNLAYPVLITLKNKATGQESSSGSGFFLENDNTVYLVTAKHVLFDPKATLLNDTADLLSYSKDPSDFTQNLITLDLLALQKAGNIKINASEDVAVIKIFTRSGEAFPVSGVTVRQHSAAGILAVGINTTKRFSEVLTGNDVMLFGYPTSLELKQLGQLDSHRPLLRKGIVAGTNPPKRSIILDCPVYFGNSGGPVMEIDRSAFKSDFRIIGVVSQYVPFLNSTASNTVLLQFVSNSGYSIATPMDFVLDLINEDAPSASLK